MVFTATAASLLDGEAFNRLVAEEDLRVWEQDGYIYTKRKGKDGIELYRTYGPKWAMLYQARRVVTQNNAGGGALDIKIAVAMGMVAQMVALKAIGSATAGATMNVWLVDEDNAVVVPLSTQAAGASRNANLPSIGTAPSATNNNDAQSLGLRLGPGQKIEVYSSAAAQTETTTASVVFLMPITAKESDITWDVSGSVGTPSLAASTISAANTMQAVLLP